MLPPDAKIFDLLKPFSKDVVASIIKPIVASLRGVGGGGRGFARYQGPLFSVPAVGKDHGNEAGRRENSAREEWGKGTPATTLLFTPNRPNPSFPSLRSWRFFYSFSLVVGKVRDTVAQKPKTRSNQKTVEEGSWGEGSEIFLRCFFLSSSPPLPSFFR